MKVLAFDIGGTFIKYALMDEHARIIYSGKFPTPLSGRDELINTLTMIYKENPQAEGIAISMAGIIDCKEGRCLMGGALSYNDDFLLRDALYSRCNTRIVIENDAKCAAMAEASIGSLKDVSDGMVIILGTMIGGGLIHENRLVRGKHFSAGEVSYIRTSVTPLPDRKEFWGNQCSALELCRLYAQRIGEDPKNVDGKKVFEAYFEGSEQAKEALSIYCKNIAYVLFNLQTIYDPERIAIGGGISAQEVLIELIKEELNRLYSECPYSLPKANVVKCTYANNANLIGALQCFLKEG